MGEAIMFGLIFAIAIEVWRIEVMLEKILKRMETPVG